MGLKGLVVILMGSVLVNNYVLSRFLGICPFLGVSKKLNQAVGMGVSVTFVMLMATAVTWPIQKFILERFGLEYTQTIVFILIIASLVQFVEIVLKKFIPALHKSLGVYLPLITTNCAVLGVTINNINDYGYMPEGSFVTSMVSSLGCGLGFMLAMVIFSGVRSRIDESNIPKSFRGLPVTLIAASFVSLAFFGFASIVENLLGEPVIEKVEPAPVTTDINPILIAFIVVAAIGLIASIVLVLASHFLKVEEDETVAKVRECLPGANCGACGYAGCDSYAEAVANGKAEANLCIPGGAGVATQIGEVLGVAVSAAEEKVAFVFCNGDCNAVESMDVVYEGVEGCNASKLIYGGPSACKYGCIGCGDCASVCPVNAICVHDGLAHINPDLCIACGKCVKTCPNKVIDIIPKKSKVVVMCNNIEKGAVARKQCKNVCFGCKKCERVCPTQAIKVENNLARIDYNKCSGCRECFNSCVTNCIKAVDFYEGTIG